MAGNPAQIGLFSRAATRFRSDDHHHHGHLNFKSANAYFCTEPLIGGGGVRHRFEFQIFARATRVERGTDQLSNVSARLCAVICFALPLPLLFHLPSPRSTISSGFYLWRHRLRIGIDSVIYSRTDRLSSTGRSISSRENDRERERLARNRILSKTSFSFESLPLFLSLSVTRAS